MMLPPSLLADLQLVLGDRLSRAESELTLHGRGETHLPARLPDVVVYPETTEEVSAIVRACGEHGVPVIPFGAGSSLEGHIAALHGGVSLDLSRMNAILRTSVEDMDITVQAGVTRLQLAKHLGGTGATFFVDPGADATIGGMVATGASGTTTVRYGTIRENILGLTVVMADGSVIRTGSRARKSSAGYDLTRLFAGSEGTLGVITEVTLKLQPVPDAIASATCAFATIDEAVEAVVALLQCGVPLARIELLDALTVGAVNHLSGLGLPESPMIFLELHAFSKDAIAEQLAAAEEVVGTFGGRVHGRATTEEERARLWEARHKVYFAGLAMRPGSRSWTTDVCVPISQLARVIRETREDLDANGVFAPLVGHVGDGNFHLLLLIDPNDDAALARARAVNDRLVGRAIACGGTCTGEHGIGMGKKASLAKQHGDALPVMRAIKRALDPRNLLNPGKVFDLDDATPAETPTVTFRRGVSADAERLAVFAERTFVETFGHSTSPEHMAEHVARSYGPDIQRAELEDADCVTLVHERDGAIVAYAQVRWGEVPEQVRTPAAMELKRFYVDPSLHGGGVARPLMEECFRAARSMGGRALWLSVWEENVRAIAFYTKVGFIDAGGIDFWLGSDRQCDRVMVASLVRA